MPWYKKWEALLRSDLFAWGKFELGKFDPLSKPWEEPVTVTSILQEDAEVFAKLHDYCNKIVALYLHPFSNKLANPVPLDLTVYDVYVHWKKYGHPTGFDGLDGRYLAAPFTTSERNYDTLIEQHHKYCSYMDTQLEEEAITLSREEASTHSMYYIHPIFRALIVLIEPYPMAKGRQIVHMIRTGNDRYLSTGPIDLDSVSNKTVELIGRVGADVIETNLKTALIFITDLDRQEMAYNTALLKSQQLHTTFVNTRISVWADGEMEHARKFGPYASFWVEASLRRSIEKSRKEKGFSGPCIDDVMPEWDYEGPGDDFRWDISKKLTITPERRRRTKSLSKLPPVKENWEHGAQDAVFESCGLVVLLDRQHIPENIPEDILEESF